MKKRIDLFCAAALMSALCASFVACNEPDKPDEPSVIMPDPYANCFVFVKTTPGEETILLAKSGITHYDALAIHADYESEHGKGNTTWSGYFPNGSYNLSDLLAADPEAVTNCYEITVTVKLAEFVVPYPDQLRKYFSNHVIKIEGDILIYKDYYWAYTEERAETLATQYVQYFQKSHDGMGTIINTSIKKLGSEIHNEPIVF